MDTRIFSIDGKRISIDYKTQVEPLHKKILENCIIYLYTKYPDAQLFSNMNIEVYRKVKTNLIRKLLISDDHNNPSPAHVSDDKIYLNADWLEAIIGKTQAVINVPIIHEMIAHELNHLWQTKTASYAKILQVNKRLNSLPSENTDIWKSLFHKRLTSALDVRRALFDFIELLMVEGIGFFGGKYSTKGIYYSQKSMMDHYNTSKNKISEIEKTYDTFFMYIKKIYGSNDPFERRKKISELENLLSIKNFDIYHIGLHMVYTILYVDKDSSLEDVAKMSYIQFIRKYESCMQELDLKPVVSYNSRKGMMDYSTLLELANGAYKS